MPFTNGVVDRPWVVGREFESHVHHENAFLIEKCISSCQESDDESLSLGPQRLYKNFGVGTYAPLRRPRIPLFKGGESVIRLSLGRRLVNLLPVAQRTNAFTNVFFVVLPTTPCCNETGLRHRVSPCRSAYFASPWWLLTLISQT